MSSGRPKFPTRTGFPLPAKKTVTLHAPWNWKRSRLFTAAVGLEGGPTDDQSFCWAPARSELVDGCNKVGPAVHNS